jgi:hypothetical protein
MVVQVTVWVKLVAEVIQLVVAMMVQAQVILGTTIHKLHLEVRVRALL